MAKDEVLDVIEALAEIGNAVGKAQEDGKISLADLIYLGPVGLKLPAALSGITSVPAQISNATPEQISAWKVAFSERFDLADDEAEAMVEDYLSIATLLTSTIIKHHFTPPAGQ